MGNGKRCMLCLKTKGGINVHFHFKFSGKVLEARLAQGYTQREVADAISVTVRWYQRVEKGEKLPGSMVLLRLILFLNLNVEDFREEVGLIDPIPTVYRRTPRR